MLYSMSFFGELYLKRCKGVVFQLCLEIYYVDCFYYGRGFGSIESSIVYYILKSRSLRYLEYLINYELVIEILIKGFYF